MPNYSKAAIFLLISLLAFSALACGLGLPPLSPPVTIPADTAATAAAAAQQAGQVAATTAALAGQQGETLLATVQATDFDASFAELQQKLAALQPDANGNYTIVLTDAEINQGLQGQPEISQDGVTIQGLAVTFTGGNVVLTGNLTEPIAAQLTATFRPEVNDGQLTFSLVSAQLGRLPVPTSILQSVETTLNATIGNLMNNLPAGITLQSVFMGEGTMTVIAHQS
ncbi:MAG: hypothetical protein KDE29_03645 [Anaerolineales bacterium]|nr:hypothetical protein [Anaerolineales bacterium]